MPFVYKLYVLVRVSLYRNYVKRIVGWVIILPCYNLSCRSCPRVPQGGAWVLPGVLDSGGGNREGPAGQSVTARLCWQKETPPQKLAARPLSVAGDGALWSVKSSLALYPSPGKKQISERKCPKGLQRLIPPLGVGRSCQSCPMFINHLVHTRHVPNAYKYGHSQSFHNPWNRPSLQRRRPRQGEVKTPSWWGVRPGFEPTG